MNELIEQIEQIMAHQYEPLAITVGYLIGLLTGCAITSIAYSGALKRMGE